jgi:hypothetical protein
MSEAKLLGSWVTWRAEAKARNGPEWPSVGGSELWRSSIILHPTVCSRASHGQAACWAQELAFGRAGPPGGKPPGSGSRWLDANSHHPRAEAGC